MDRHSRVAVHRTPVLCADGAPPGQQVYSHIPNALWANVRNFPGSPGILRAHKRWGPDQLPGNDSNESRVRRAIPRASAIHTCDRHRGDAKPRVPRRESAEALLVGPAVSPGSPPTGTSTRSSPCWQSAPRTWPRRKIGDITRAALVLTHFEHSYIT